MKVLGLILELNPPHTGHAYFIDQAKKIVRPDYTICTLSTSFCQRGLPSCIDKWQKAKIALKLGVDFVFELPVSNFMQSADAFCRGSIEILTKLNVTDIAFGAELTNLDKLKEIVNIMESVTYNNSLKNYLAKGSSYASSSLKAMMEQTSDQEIIDNLSLPNNILALGYLKALKYYPNINIHLIKRINNDYNDLKLTKNGYSSASAVRYAISANNKDYLNYVIDKEYEYLDEKLLLDNLFKLIRYQFAIHDLSYFKDIICVDEGIEVRIKHFLYQANSFKELASLVRTKRYSLNHVNRVLVNIALENKKTEEYEYLRLLAFDKDKKAYLSSLDKRIKKLIFSSPLDHEGPIIFNELKASKIYDIISGKLTYTNEYAAPITGDEEDE